MPVFARKKPCGSCPYRRDAAPGWLGSSDPVGFMEQTLSRGDLATAMPCHAAIDYDEPGWQEDQYPDAPVCVGSLQFLNNHLKMPDGDLVGACAEVGRNDDVFRTTGEFLEYHGEDRTVMFLGWRAMIVGDPA